ncbi:MAG TPA: sigma-70 family RNA polymerase sigma factor [Nocardioidaceae bacterium]|nr:sigma-70 family RNA polymerase sigma factor [Nocardioidaceae bacterium]
MTTVKAEHVADYEVTSASHPAPTDDWVTLLTTPGPAREQAIRRLHELMVRAAARQVSRMSEARTLGWTRREEIVQASADEATMAILDRLGSFQGRSRFTTWAYKFAILQVAVELRRAAWRPRVIDLDLLPELASTDESPESHADTAALVDEVRRAIAQDLSPHQRRVLTALVVSEIPIDVLADQMATTRNALYKTLSDARRQLRQSLSARGLLPAAAPKKARP